MKFKPQVTALYLYPIKSTQPYCVQQATVTSEGLHFDRRFMLTDNNGAFITARKHGGLYDVTAYPTPQGLWIQHRDGSHIEVHYSDFTQTALCTVWGTEFESLVAKADINQWFSEKLQSAVQLRWCGFASERRIQRYPDTALSFADGYPLLLTNQHSLEQVQRHCPVEIDMRQFRPNIVIQHVQAFAENTWQRIKIGQIEFINAKACERCILTTRDLASGQLQPKSEPFRTLKKHFANEQGKPIFGANLIAMQSGVIHVGDTLEILA
ncbi:MOSC domain-containing protein [Spirabiliibacterium falconis]|uniref:MOSC domain-containing protein n=1 Tax=Spirabiliibacterium falconis TaxID=572023 RepID=UPI001AAD0AC3|nr:MOSC domain-containing protein [Spirabiliibacterium falconis]MBE2894182.1 MOSC domain-containing protein [Spirabiliibacterium falconis]